MMFLHQYKLQGNKTIFQIGEPPAASLQRRPQRAPLFSVEIEQYFMKCYTSQLHVSI